MTDTDSPFQTTPCGQLEGVVFPELGTLQLSGERGTHVLTIQPRVGSLQLLARGRDELLKDTIIVPQPVAPPRKGQGGHTVNVARSETAETTVTERGITLFIEEVLEVLLVSPMPLLGPLAIQLPSAS